MNNGIKQRFIDAAIVARNLVDVTWPLRRLRRQAPPSKAVANARRFLILPSDPNDPSGSMGEMAMLTGLMQSIRAQHRNASFTLIGVRPHRVAVPAVGEIDVLPAWRGAEGSIEFARILRRHDAFFALGADVLDGKYGAALVGRFAGYCNHAVETGISATIIGFSFSRTPRRPAVHALSRLHGRVRVNVRDQPSMDRFESIVGVPATLCADVAFLTAPASESDPDLESWVSHARAESRMPVAVNINAHAFSAQIASMGVQALVTAIAAQLSAVGEKNRLAYLLLPHDLKPNSGDIALLQALEKSLRSFPFPHVRYLLIPDPARIKRSVELVDLVVTARMHLAIASLGVATPVISIEYQDKFAGLYRHLGLSADEILNPAQCVTDEFTTRISSAIARLESTRRTIRQNLPRVMELARRNVEFG